MDLCADCGEPATTTMAVATGPSTYIDESLCAACFSIRDNYDPPDADGAPALLSRVPSG